MPSSEEILSNLSAIANEWRTLSIVWHLYFGALAFGLIAGWRPSVRIIGVLYLLPLLSVSALAWVNSNPFNGVTFAIAGIALFLASLKAGKREVRIAPAWLVIIGVMLIIFGWVYPHFLVESEPFQYIYSAPTGLIPCPTLSIAIGFTLVVRGLNSRGWCLMLALLGLFYGLLGAVWLKVEIDWILVFGALASLYLAFSSSLIMNGHGVIAR